jgi:hypothetical protein
MPSRKKTNPRYGKGGRDKVKQVTNDVDEAANAKLRSRPSRKSIARRKQAMSFEQSQARRAEGKAPARKPGAKRGSNRKR